jgi:hypothetical protein
MGNRRGWRICRWLVALTAVSAALALPSFAAAATAPDNDDYLLSSVIASAQTRGVKETTFTDSVDTTAATTQSDLFNPDPFGSVNSGGGAEPTNCEGVPYGKTVWYDIRPVIPGEVELTTAAGFQTVIALYEYDPQTFLLKSEIDCQSTNSLTNDLAESFELQPGHTYTVQVGGRQTVAGIGGGPMDFTMGFFPDHDDDTVLDGIDGCPTLKGVQRFGGCPPTIIPVPRFAYASSGTATTLSLVRLDHVPGAVQVQARCRKCGFKVSAKSGPRASSVVLSGLKNKTIAAGDKLEIWVTKKATGTGQYKFGAIGAYISYVAKGGTLVDRVLRCLMPGSMTPRTQCPPGGRKKHAATGATADLEWNRIAGRLAGRLG